MVKLSIGYPRPEEEEEILKRRAERKQDNVALQAVITPEVFLAMRAAVEEVYVDPDVRRYMVELAASTRRHQQVVVGVSPRGIAGSAQSDASLGRPSRPRLCGAG